MSEYPYELDLSLRATESCLVIAQDLATDLAIKHHDPTDKEFSQIFEILLCVFRAKEQFFLIANNENLFKK